MQSIATSFAKLLVYLFELSPLSLLSLFAGGFFLGWFSVAYARGVEVIAAGKTEKYRGGWWRLIVALVLVGLAVASQGSSMVLSHWPVLLFGLIFGILFILFRWWTLGGFGLLLFGCLFLSALLVWTFKAYTGKTAVLEIRVRGVEGQNDPPRLSLIVKDLKKETENTYYVYGEQWGVSANVVLFDDWVVFLGGKTYYRLNSIVGATDTTLDQRYLDDISQPMWSELEKNEDKLPGVRAVYKDMILKEPIVGTVYTIYIDNDGALVPEVKETAPEQE